MIPGEEAIKDAISILDQIPKSGSLPIGRYRFNVTGAKDLTAAEAVGKRRQFEYAMQVIESLPPGLEGHEHVERFTVGTESDPEGKDPQSLKAQDNWGAMAWARFKQAIGAGNQFVGTVEANETANGTYNRLRSLYPASTKLSEIPAPSTTPRKSKAPAKPAVGQQPQFQVAGVAEDAPPAAPQVLQRQDPVVACQIPGCGKKVPKADLVKHVTEHMSAAQPSAGQE